MSLNQITEPNQEQEVYSLMMNSIDVIQQTSIFQHNLLLFPGTWFIGK